MKKYITVCALTLLSSSSLADTIQATSLTTIPLYDKHSVVLFDNDSQCRYISHVEKTMANDANSKVSWSLHIKEEWCRKKNGRQERLENFKARHIALLNELPKGTVIRF